MPPSKVIAAMDRRTTSDYADWYDLEKLQKTVSGLYDVTQFHYIANKGIDGLYCAAIMQKSGG